MLSKKNKLIIGIIVLLLIIVSALVLLVSKKDNREQNNAIFVDRVNQDKLLNSNISLSTTTNHENTTEPIVNGKAVEARNAEYLVELKNNHPEYSTAQLEFYSETAAKKEMTPCLGKDDESNCISAVAFITRSDNFCGEVKEIKDQFSCSDIILNKEATAKISDCQSRNSSDLIAKCLINIFSIYKQPENCVNLISEDLKKECSNVAYYQMAIENQADKFCVNITNENIKNYCLEGTVTGTQDSDNDGLSDEDETKIYKTDFLKFDTDGDGYSDGDEVKSEHNPNGV